MKDTNIHEGLENETLREVICNGLIKACFDKLPEPPQRNYPNDSEGQILYRVESKRQDIKEAEFEIDKAVRQLPYVKMMNEFGWSEHDISDYLGKTGEYYRSFIGTGEEYNNLLTKIKN